MERKNGYTWDVFISYPHGKYDEEVAKWVTETFLGPFRHRLRQALGRLPEIYIDEEAINPGDTWQPMLMGALARSIIMVPFWCINYFESEYCRKELAVMLHREQQLGYRTTDNPHGLVVPVQVWDGNLYPQVAKDIQQLRCQKYTSVSEGTPGYAELMEMIENWVPNLAERIEDAPPWDPAWLTREWLDGPADACERSRTLWTTAMLTHLGSMGEEGDDDGDEEDAG